MVNMKVNKGNINLGISGELGDIVAEVVYGIGKIHEKIKETDEKSGDVFEGLLMIGLLKVFRPDDADRLAEELKKLSENDEEEDDDDEEVLDDIIELLTKVRDAK